MPTLASRLLAWYEHHRRDLPWRSRPEETPDPYRVWLSEIMLQQTTVATVGPYFRRFVTRWPTVAALASADLDQLLQLWAGLGYYARARNLHACAKAVIAAHGGRFPDTESGLRALPGIGPYTAGAIAAIAFDRPAAAVDGNVERVVARLFAIETPLPAAKAEIRARAGALVPAKRPGDFAQAMMDLGATVCVPRTPRCPRCPLAGGCLARARGIAADLPQRAPKPLRPWRRGLAFWAARPDGAVLFHRRPESGLLGGMMEVPSTPWREAPWDDAEALRHAPCPGPWRRLDATVAHGFTHFRLELGLFVARLPAGRKPPGLWLKPEDFAAAALPTVMKKLCQAALDAAPARTSTRTPAVARR